MKIDKGDFLTFASIAHGLGILPVDQRNTLEQCEIKPGIYRRHPKLTKDDSRSDISRDGYMGVLFQLVISNDTKRLDTIISAIIRTRGKVGTWGKSDYINIWPLIFIFTAARYGKWVPTPPIFVGPFSTGFRAHLATLLIHIERMIGKSGYSHIYTMQKLVIANPKNPWFYALYCLVTVDHFSHGKFESLMSDIPDDDDAGTGWGSCPNRVLKGLAIHAKDLL